jgi:hypothetical protein
MRCSALLCSALRCSALPSSLGCGAWLGWALFWACLACCAGQSNTYLPRQWAVADSSSWGSQRQNQSKTRAPDDIVDLPYLTQSCLGHADPRDLWFASCASNDSNVCSCSYSDLNHQASLFAPGSLGPTVARSPCFSHVKSRNLFQSEAAAIDCGPSSSSTGSSSACMVPSFGHWAIGSDTLSVQT